VAGLALIASAGALASTALNNDLFAVIAVVGVVVTLVATRLFGQAEFHLIRRWFGRRWRRLTADASFDEMVVHLQGTADWDDVWEDLTGCAEQLNLQSVCLDVNAPALHENYHAQWERSDGRGPASHLWRLEIPLFGVGDVIGRLAVSGVRDDEPVADKLMTLAKIIETAEVGAAEATRSPTPPATVPAA
jgi:UDP-GlcNAc:undecaprenyl-phosphate GlcNAc-1-phosphate transferase